MAKPSWITLSKSSGTGGGQVNVTAARNSGTSDRSGTISVKTTSGLSKEIEITQSAAGKITFSGSIQGNGIEAYREVFSSSQAIMGTSTAPCSFSFDFGYSLITGSGINGSTSSPKTASGIRWYLSRYNTAIKYCTVCSISSSSPGKLFIDGVEYELDNSKQSISSPGSTIKCDWGSSIKIESYVTFRDVRFVFSA